MHQHVKFWFSCLARDRYSCSIGRRSWSMCHCKRDPTWKQVNDPSLAGLVPKGWVRGTVCLHRILFTWLQFFIGTPMLVPIAFHWLADVLPFPSHFFTGLAMPCHWNQSDGNRIHAIKRSQIQARPRQLQPLCRPKPLPGRLVRRALVWAQPEERSPEESKCNRSNFRSKGCCKTKDQGSPETKGKQDLIRSRHPALHCELWTGHWKEGSDRQTWQRDLNSQMQISFVFSKSFLIFVFESGKLSKLIWRAAWGQSIASLPRQVCLGAGEETFSLRGVAFLLLMVALDDAPYCQLGGRPSWNEAAAGALDARCIITSH